MADLFDPDQSAAELRGALERAKVDQSPGISVPDLAPLFRRDAEGRVVDRSGTVLLEKLAPIPPARKG